MLRKALILAVVLGVVGMLAPSSALAGCPSCDKVAEKGEGFCDQCKKGLAYGVKVASEALYKAVVGAKVEEDKMTCPGCKEAAKTNGRCETCKVGWVQGQVYASAVGYALAKGEPSTAEKAAHCPGCAEAFKTDGFCTACNGGFVAGRAYMNQGDHDAAKAAHTTLTTAAEKAAKCEHCAVAMVNNGTCEKCKVSYKDGQPAKM